jgi:exodeoxyribonuclease-5
VDDLKLSADQSIAVERAIEWRRKAPPVTYCDNENCEAEGEHTHGGAQDYLPFSIGGLAGSGKTALAGVIAKELGISVKFATPTHQSAAVLRKKLNGYAAGEKSTTFHSILYRPIEKLYCMITRKRVRQIPCSCAKHGQADSCACPVRYTNCGTCKECIVRSEVDFRLRDFFGGHCDLLILDECSMISEQRIAEMRSFGVPILMFGDFGQLSPVKEKMNQFIASPNVKLTVNHRQGESSGIIAAAYEARQNGKLRHGTYGDGSTACVSAKQLPDVLDAMNPDRLAPGPDSAIICQLNRTRAQINRRLHGGSPLPVPGDRVVCLVNIYSGLDVMEQLADGTWKSNGKKEFTYNGSRGTVAAVAPSGIVRPDMTELIVKLDDGPYVHTVAVTRQFGAEKKLDLWQEKIPKGSDLWDYSFATTAHRAQGSEFKRVVVLDTAPPEPKRWLYTSATRAREKLLVIDWRD